MRESVIISPTLVVAVRNVLGGDSLNSFAEIAHCTIFEFNCCDPGCGSGYENGGNAVRKLTVPDGSLDEFGEITGVVKALRVYCNCLRVRHDEISPVCWNHLVLNNSAMSLLCLLQEHHFLDVGEGLTAVEGSGFDTVEVDTGRDLSAEVIPGVPEDVVVPHVLDLIPQRCDLLAEDVVDRQ